MARSEPKTTKMPKEFTPRFLESLDHRHGTMREIRRRFEALVEDTGADSAQKEMLCRRATFLAILLETQEHEALETGKLDAGSYTQTNNALLGILKALGLDKKVKSATDLKSYIETRRTKK